VKLDAFHCDDDQAPRGFLLSIPRAHGLLPSEARSGRDLVQEYDGSRRARNLRVGLLLFTDAWHHRTGYCQEMTRGLRRPFLDYTPRALREPHDTYGQI